MGKITTESPKETTTPHFSHPHPLKLCSYVPLQTPNLSSSCSGCKLQPSGLIYTCTVCSYFLHKNCFEMPMKITHPCHKDHALTLLAQPAYADRMFKCDACGEIGDGFSYHCKPCGNDLHILCSVMPLSVTHASHVHKLELTFGSPYPTKDFSCDLCKKVGSDHWIYRCSICAFDAHLHCAKSVAPVNNMGSFQPHQGPAPQGGPTFTRSAPQPSPGCGPHYTAATPPPMQHNFFPPPPAAGIPAGFPVPQHNPYTVNVQRDQLFLQYLQQIIQNNNAMTQAILAGGTTGLGAGGVAGLGGGFGGGTGGFGAGGLGGAGGGFGAGGFGGNNGYQQLMQLYSSINASGGGAGGQEFLQALMNGGFGGGTGGFGAGGLGGAGGGFGAGGFGGVNGYQQLMQLYSSINAGGGGGQEFLQAFVNGGFGGGGGGLDLLQSLSGGGGGLDFLGGMLGGFGL